MPRRPHLGDNYDAKQLTRESMQKELGQEGDSRVLRQKERKGAEVPGAREGRVGIKWKRQSSDNIGLCKAY